MVAGPVLVAILVVGLLVSVFQVATQIQEMTLSFVPKLMITAFLLIAFGPWMINSITHFATSLYLTIPSIGGN